MNAPLLQEILIVDDNLVDRKAIRRCLAGHNVVIHETDSGKEALELISARNFSCIFLDYLLPDIDGLSLLQQLYDPRKDQIKTPIVMLTGQGSEKIMLAALRWGVQDYLLKSQLSPEMLMLAMKKAQEAFALKLSRRQAEEQLQHSRRMEAVGQLTSGVAHDFNNLLTVILGNLHLMKERVESLSDISNAEYLKKKIQTMETVSGNGARLIKRLMLFTRQSSLSQTTVNVNDSIVETSAILKGTLGAAVEINTRLTNAVWPVSIDVSEFCNALINLAINARDAMPQGGRLTIETDNITLDESHVALYPDIVAGPYVMVAVSDTGSGMKAETAQRIFEPFFTTKPPGEGTGLGLSMVYGFVRQSGGHIYVESEENRGTVFKAFFPRAEAEKDAGKVAGVPQRDIPSRSGGVTTADQEVKTMPSVKRVLVIDDDDFIRMMICEVLAKLDYDVLNARSSEEGLALMAGSKLPDVVITDIIMPGKGGLNAIREIRNGYPKVGIVAISGGGSPTGDYLAIAKELGADVVLPKPINPKELGTILRGLVA